MEGIFTDILAICLLTFLFWNGGEKLDNWDKLNKIIQAQYYEAEYGSKN